MDLNKMQKFKIYEIYKNKTILFYIIVLFYTEMVTEFCSSYFIFLSDKSMPSFGDPGKFAELTPIGVATCVILFVFFACLIIIPVIWLTIKSKHDNIRKIQVFSLWGTVVFAGALGVLMAVFGFTMPCKAAEALADFLNQKFSLFEII